jgi:hypothetical protein
MSFWRTNMKTIIFFFMTLFCFASFASSITIDEAGSKALSVSFKKSQEAGDKTVKYDEERSQYSVNGEISCFYFHSTEFNDCFIADSIRITDQEGADVIESLRKIEKSGNEFIRSGYDGNITSYKTRNVKIECLENSCLIKP